MKPIPWRYPRTLFVSFPKCGRTWFRYQLAKYLELRYERSPALGFGDRIEFSHDYFGALERQEKPGKPCALVAGMEAEIPVLWLVRDPRDTVVSYYYQKVRREGRVHGYGEKIDEFVTDPTFGIERLCQWTLEMYWWVYWASMVRLERTVFADRYETQRDGRASWLGFARLLLRDLDEALWREAARSSRFEAMREFQITSPLPEMGGGARLGGEKVRRGVVGGFRDELRPETLAFFDKSEIVRETLARLGYER